VLCRRIPKSHLRQFRHAAADYPFDGVDVSGFVEARTVRVDEATVLPFGNAKVEAAAVVVLRKLRRFIVCVV
jgi:hypothetical protein